MGITNWGRDYKTSQKDYRSGITKQCRIFVAINFSESIKGQNLRKNAKFLYIFLTTPNEVQWNSSDNCIHYYNVKNLNLFDAELQLINTKPVIKNKLKGLLKELKKFRQY